MPRIRVSPRAEQDIEAILAWTHEVFGEKARLKYEALLGRAILDIAESADRAGSRERPEIGPSVRTYHLRNSRDRIPKSRGRVRHPRHILLYRALDDGLVEIGRVLHDEMDLASHLPDDYQES